MLTFTTNPESSFEITTNLKSIPELKNIKIGTMHIQLMHTSAGITLNENYDDDVKLDMNDFLKKLVPPSNSYRHCAEGSDDILAHIKSSLVGTSLTISIAKGKLNLGKWQGVWLMEFRSTHHKRNIIVTIQGQI